jgi:opacity protein-like surface antigen
MKSSPIIAAIAAAIVTFTALPARAESFSGPSAGIEFATEDFESYEDTATTLVAGWDFVVGSDWRVGFGLRWTVADIEERASEPLGANIQDISVTFDNRRGANLRLGRVLGDRWMAYAELGYEQYDVDAVRVLRAPVCAPPNGCVISTLDGSFDESMTSVGMGVELAATDRLRLRAAYSRGNSDAFDRDRLSVAAAWAF